MEFPGIKKIRFFTVFPLTAAEKKVLGFLTALTLLGLATLGFEALGGRFPADGLPSAMSRVPLQPPVYVSHGSSKFSKFSPVLDLNRATEEQLRQNLGAIGWNLTTEQVAALDAASAKTPAYPYWHQASFGERNPFPTNVMPAK